MVLEIFKVALPAAVQAQVAGGSVQADAGFRQGEVSTGTLTCKARSCCCPAVYCAGRCPVGPVGVVQRGAAHCAEPDLAAKQSCVVQFKDAVLDGAQKVSA